MINCNVPKFKVSKSRKVLVWFFLKFQTVVLLMLIDTSHSCAFFQDLLKYVSDPTGLESVEEIMNDLMHGFDKWMPESSIRNYKDEKLFHANKKSYDAYEKDIALVEISFRKSSIIQMERKARMNWIDYFSTVGGLLGLVLGMGIISLIEMVWVCLRILALKMNFQNIVP